MVLAELTIPDWALAIMVGFVLTHFLGGVAWGINMTYKVRELFMRDDLKDKRLATLEVSVEAVRIKGESTHTAVLLMSDQQKHLADDTKEVKILLNKLMEAFNDRTKAGQGN